MARQLLGNIKNTPIMPRTNVIINGFDNSNKNEFLTLSSRYYIPADFLEQPGRKMKVKIVGEVLSNESNRLMRMYMNSKYVSTGANVQEHISVPFQGLGQFEIEFETIALNNTTQYNTGKCFMFGEEKTFYNKRESSLVLGEPRKIIFSIIADRLDIELKIDYIDVQYI